MQIGPNCVVSIYYTLTNDNGEVMDQSPEGKPLLYLHGAAGIIPGLEKELAGKVAGDAFKVMISPEEGYGPHHPEMVQEIPRSSLPNEIEMELGMLYTVNTNNGPMNVTVVSITPDSITLDGNHPLAGKVLHFEGQVESVREATPEELDHGHAH